MTTGAVPSGGEARRLLSEVRALAQRVRLDQRVTWVALLMLAGVTLLAIPAEYVFLHADCASAIAAGGGAPCRIRGLARPFFWLPALLLAYSAIALYAVRVTRARGLGARVLPFMLTGVVLALLSATAWFGATQYFDHHAVPAHPLPAWAMVLDRLVAPTGTIGVALLVLAWLERHIALMWFAFAYLAVVLVPITFGFRPPWGYLSDSLAPLIVSAVFLLAGAAGFTLAHRREQ